MDIMRRAQQESAAAKIDAQEDDFFGLVDDDGAYEPFETFEMYRVTCPDCGQPIALLADEDTLPEHALCPSPWNPFGLTVCRGSGRPAAEAPSSQDTTDAQEQDAAMLLTLPESLDWRRQPFSHIGGPGSRPARVPEIRRSA
ncbi:MULTISPECIES: hypothetical protein [Streptomyces]|uniref:Uncharacterized protein n=2 Tax=Streptomyces TaxID=1883 RepID=A0A4Q9HT45_STRKA|nr:MULTISPECIES: hypothetical protein [Streptomyces]MYU50570.1 hypothetical protein [Streptomyces sp. SID7805]TBO58227.1 hypothetical protein EYS09_18575 [Streptomyces kasugaensis]WSK16976.1 hypothetical protein OG717_37710 [Streptomyces celluloflavus]